MDFDYYIKAKMKREMATEIKQLGYEKKKV